MHAGQPRQLGAGPVEPRGGVDHRGIVAFVELAFLEGGRIDAHAQRLAENEDVACLGTAVALEILRIDRADGHQAVDGFHRVDGVAARQGHAGVTADRLTAFQDAGDDIVRQHVDGHADDGQRHDGLPPHGVDIGQCVGGRNPSEVVGVVDNGHEEIGGGHDGLVLVDAVDGGIIGGLGAHQQVGEELGRHAASGQQVSQHARGDLAAAAAAVRERGEARGVGGGSGHGMCPG